MVRMSGARAMVAQLKREGVQQAFTVPGESFLSILDALYDDDQIELVATRHEEGAAFAAEAIGKLTGQPALCMSTRGVGSTNMAIAFHTAYQDSSPLIAIIGQVETTYRHREAFQEVELAPFYAHICKWTAEVTSTDRLPEYIHEAARRAIAGDPARSCCRSRPMSSTLSGISSKIIFARPPWPHAPRRAHTMSGRRSTCYSRPNAR